MSERENGLLENGMILEASSPLGIQQNVPETVNSCHSEDARLIARARAVGVVYELAQPAAVESEDAKRKRQRRNQRRVTVEERLHEVVGDLPPPPPAGST